MLAHSDPATKRPLVTKDKPIPVGRFRVIRPTGDFNHLRVRYTPPKGLVYGPTDLDSRPTDLTLPAGQRILNPRAPWCQWDPTQLPESSPLFGDGRNNPGGLYVTANDDPNSRRSVGIIDDMVDGLLTVTISDDLVAHARLAVSPPDFAPDRRPFVSLADGLKDRVDRLDEVESGLFEDPEALDAIVRDIFERVFETAANSNLDAQNQRSAGENARTANFRQEVSPGPAWPIVNGPSVDGLPLTLTGRRRHRQLSNFEILSARVRDGTTDLSRWIRPPIDDSEYYDSRMPPLMRGSDRRPMHLTRRQ